MNISRMLAIIQYSRCGFRIFHPATMGIFTLFLSCAGGQRGRPPIAVEVHYPRTSARVYFTCASLSAICFIDVHVQFTILVTDI